MRAGGRFLGKDEGMFPRHEFTGIVRPRGSEVCPLQCLSFQYEGVFLGKGEGTSLGQGRGDVSQATVTQVTLCARPASIDDDI